MSILKRKAIRAHKRFAMTNPLQDFEAEDTFLLGGELNSKAFCAEYKGNAKPDMKQRRNVHYRTETLKSSANIVKNYSRALVNFAVAKTADPYLEVILSKYGLSFHDFQRFVNSDCKKVNCIKSLRQKLSHHCRRL